MNSTNQPLLEQVKAIAHAAGEAILQVYRGVALFDIQNKADNTPITNADRVAHNIIVQALAKLQPQCPVLSEESEGKAFSERQQWQRYWLVDPLDGTKEFIEGTDEFSVLIALIEQHTPIMGVIYAPVTHTYYFAERGCGAFKQVADAIPEPIQTAAVNTDHLRIIASRRHTKVKALTQLDTFASHDVVHLGSALKFAAVASGEADIYPRFGLTSEWDTAAGQCIVEEAGGKVMNLFGEVLQYNTKESLLNPEFVVVGDPDYPWLRDINALLSK